MTHNSKLGAAPGAFDEIEAERKLCAVLNAGRNVMHGETATRRALLDLRLVDARRLRHWRWLSFAALCLGMSIGYWIR